MHLLQLRVVWHLCTAAQKLRNLLAIKLDSLLLRPHRLILANVGPGGLDAGHTTRVDGLRVSFAQLEESFTCDEPLVEGLRPHTLENFGAQSLHLRDELRSHLLVG